MRRLGKIFILCVVALTINASLLILKNVSVTSGLLVAVLLILIMWVLVLLRNRLRMEHLSTRRIQAGIIDIAEVDSMNGFDFERFTGKLLECQGYSANVTQASGDLGTDVIAEKKGKRYSVQVKRQSNHVSRRAVSDAVAGMYHYNCNACMVVTNTYFTQGAVQLAKSTNCVLVDRQKLIDWIAEFNASGGKFQCQYGSDAETQKKSYSLEVVTDETKVYLNECEIQEGEIGYRVEAPTGMVLFIPSKPYYSNELSGKTSDNLRDGNPKSDYFIGSFISAGNSITHYLVCRRDSKDVVTCVIVGKSAIGRFIQEGFNGAIARHGLINAKVSSRDSRMYLRPSISRTVESTLGLKNSINKYRELIS